MTWILLVVLAGCGSSTASVSGSISLDGQPLVGSETVRVTVMFYPESGDGAPAAAKVDQSGRYTLSTGAQAGVAPNNYVVAISANQVIPANSGGGMPSMRPLTSPDYANPKLSGLKAEVKPGRNTIDFDLKSDAKGPKKASEQNLSSEVVIPAEQFHELYHLIRPKQFRDTYIFGELIASINNSRWEEKTR